MTKNPDSSVGFNHLSNNKRKFGARKNDIPYPDLIYCRCRYKFVGSKRFKCEPIRTFKTKTTRRWNSKSS